ncbi:E3 ubiquitin-protein ligase PPP1R11 isoform X1 [Aethina tumida]|uniref:E3 ubiquitin-protein ligase PPP1R11 isoform X1 n=1 Tax=Aethina tumida TaxID=116153 RepID=UPI0021487DB4|nr:E3 ubiquitin-protein ligase PPP1R11 isoform X1 [Aethina tumida]
MTEPMSSQTQEGAQTSTLTVTESEQPQDVHTVRLKLRKPRTDRKVQWSSETVDNEHLNRKKSKCCCIYDKPRKFGESSSDSSDDECEHCHGHVEKKKKRGPCNSSSSPSRPPDLPDSSPFDGDGHLNGPDSSGPVQEASVSETRFEDIPPQPDSTSENP